MQKTHLRNFLLSLPERGLRSATALAGGLLREVGDVAIPKTIRRSQLYRNLVEATLRFLNAVEEGALLGSRISPQFRGDMARKNKTT